MAEDVYHAIKSSGCSQNTFNALSLQDFITSGSIAAHHHLKHLSLAPYYAAQMKHHMQKWDKRDNQGPGTEVVDTCCQLIGVVGMGLYYSMADVQLTVRSNCGSNLNYPLILPTGRGCSALCEQCGDHADIAAGTDQDP